jgi:hypothetical protein
MIKYEVGQVVDKFVSHQEGVLFDVSDEGASLIVFFRNPTKEETEQFKSGHRFEIRFTEIYGIIMMTFRIGSLNWMDAPYSPHLSKNLTRFTFPNESQGLGLTLIFVDVVTGEIKSMRLIGLSPNFTKKFFGLLMEQKMKEFNITEYGNALNKIYSIYPTNKIVKISSDYCKME